MPLEPAGFAQVDAELPATSPAVIDLVVPVVAPLLAVCSVIPVEHSPPDLQVLNATFLI